MQVRDAAYGRHDAGLTIPCSDEMHYYGKKLGVSPRIHRDDFMYLFLTGNEHVRHEPVKYYFEDGRNSAEALSGLLTEHTNLDISAGFSLLEFASGYGCVTRHLASVLPSAAVTACDIHPQAVAFIERELGVKATGSTPAPALLDLGGGFDVVFALSFFSHVPPRTWGDWLVALFRHVNPGGSLIFTTHGVVSHFKLRSSIQIPDNGFRFEPASEQMDLDTAEYGTAFTSTGYVTPEIFRRLRAPIALLAEGFWWGHQDVYVIAKPA